jgi:hypothetical protein
MSVDTATPTQPELDATQIATVKTPSSNANKERSMSRHSAIPDDDLLAALLYLPPYKTRKLFRLDLRDPIWQFIACIIGVVSLLATGALTLVLLQRSEEQQKSTLIETIDLWRIGSGTWAMHISLFNSGPATSSDLDFGISPRYNILQINEIENRFESGYYNNVHSIRPKGIHTVGNSLHGSYTTILPNQSGDILVSFEVDPRFDEYLQKKCVNATNASISGEETMSAEELRYHFSMNFISNSKTNIQWNEQTISCSLYFLYTVRDGDTLESIAHDYYGSRDAWWMIYQINANKIANPDLLFPGQRLRIPP